MVTAGGAPPSAPLHQAGDAACGEPAPAWKITRRPPCDGAEPRAWERKRRSGRREPDAGWIGESAGTC